MSREPLLPQPIGILLVPGFTMIALSSTIEPLRVANRYVEQPYRWSLLSLDGQPVADANGIGISVAGRLDEAAAVRTLLIIADAPPPAAMERPLAANLRSLARDGVLLGGIDTGPVILARAGLLARRRATVHWELVPTFREQFPDIELVPGLFEISGNRCTCAGGTAAMDLMLKDIEARFGLHLALRVADHCMHGRPRPAIEPQRQRGDQRLVNSRLARAIALMEAEGSETLTIPELARAVGVSVRQLYRLFADHTGASPSEFRMRVRLHHARHMLANSDVSITQAAIANGFASRSHFSRCYQSAFGHPPSRDRNRTARE